MTARSFQPLHQGEGYQPGDCAGVRSRPAIRQETGPGYIAEHGRLAWQKAFRYTVRALVEAFFSRWKRVIGDGLRFQTEDRRNAEIAIAVRTLNRMLDLGHPDSIRVA